ncbi:hypothetical protein [Streptomyces sp. NPDC093109]|uniref:hypothetical protein n=1 Tax=Streptomyces sp. NPDC093109 TaxID=3154977 RepID=UPI00344D5D82
MSIRRVSCPARIVFLDGEMAALDELEGGFTAEQALWCALEEGHTGLHHVIAQCVRGTETEPPWVMWARWPQGNEYGSERELLRLDSCPAKFLAGAVSEQACSLPEGHVGRHDYEFGPPITEADVMPDWLLRRLDE